MSTTTSNSKKRKMSRERRETRAKKKIVYTYGIDMTRDDVDEANSSTAKMEECIAAVEAIVKYRFKDKKLLEAALTHSSYTESQSYERLEFVGDIALGLAITHFLYYTYPDLDPGQLSLLRAANISTERLARVAIRHGLHNYVRHKTTVLSDKVREFVAAVEEEDEMVVHGGQMKAPKVLADIVESVVGAVYVDCGPSFENMCLIIRGLLQPLVMLHVLEKQPQPITMLFEACQKQGKIPEIKHWRKGEQNIASVYIDGEFIASGASDNKENAKLHAAEVALSKLTRLRNIEKNSVEKGPRRKIHELCNKNRWRKAIYKVEEGPGPAHDKKFIASVQIEIADKILVMKGEEMSKVKDAENSAASSMYNALKELGF